MTKYKYALHIPRIFAKSCANGHLDVAKWLHETFALSDKDARCRNNYAFRNACALNYLNVAKWLHETFKITDEEAKSDDNYAFRETFDIHTMRWLHETFKK